VAACAAVVYVGALWNGFAMDDLYIIVWNRLVHSADGVWRAFTSPYWPPDLGGKLYRPLPIASYVIDGQVGAGHAWWFHAMNLLWHAGVTVAVTALTRRLAGIRAALVAGLLFAAHPVHVEAVANVIGRAELMAAAGVCLALYTALVKDHLGWSAAALALGLLSKENAAVAPALILWAWLLGISRPPRVRMLHYVGSWLAIVAVYWPLRNAVLSPYARLHDLAPVFVGESGVAVRLTAISVLSDVARLLVFPLTLRVDYSPAERTIVHAVADPRLLIGLVCVAAWAWLLVLAWRRGRRIEAFGLGWIAIAFLPVSNLLVPIGVVLAERTLYLPSAGLAIAAGAALARLPVDRLRPVVVVLVLACAARTALRVPIWKDDGAVTFSILSDSPNSYRGPARMAALYQSHREPQRALAAIRIATRTFDRDPTLYILGADVAFTVGQPQLADTMLANAERLCARCWGYYRTQAVAARARGDSAAADSLLARIK
jgi:protein O-mannosyl-transferase